ncbi:MAG: hypothetical protein ACK5KM_12685 [Hyphomicrobiaceae bacterium]
MSRLLRGGSVRLSLVLAASLLALPLPAAAQVACQNGINTQACVNPSGTTLPYVQSTLPGVTIDNRGAINFDIGTAGADSGVTNSGSVGSGNSGDGIFIGGANPTLTLLPGSVIQGGLNHMVPERARSMSATASVLISHSSHRRMSSTRSARPTYNRATASSSSMPPRLASTTRCWRI